MILKKQDMYVPEGEAQKRGECSTKYLRKIIEDYSYFEITLCCFFIIS